jgi:N-acetyl-anhydromuramyl-L-alanine amidase AmpD
MLFMQARHFREADRRTGDIDRLVWHTAEIQEHRDSAEDVARFFQTTKTPVSAHYTVDNNSVVQCVQLKDIAFHALGDNTASVGFELSGFAGQTHEQWGDDYSRAVIDNAAKTAAKLVAEHNIPVRWLTAAELKAGRRGLVTHKLVSDVFGDGIRSDPGTQFPYKLQLERIQHHVREAKKVVQWQVSFVDRDGDRQEDNAKDPARWAATHEGAFQRGKVVFRPSKRR